MRALPLVLLLLLAAGCAINPVTGERQFMLVSAEEELGMGDQALPSAVYTYEHEYRDRELQRYLGTIVDRLHRCSHRAGMPVDFRILDTSLPNAFALPGHVFITRGLLPLLEDEAQFAAVMGHELGHVCARHSAVAMTRSMVARLGFGLAGAALEEEGQAAAGLAFKLFTLRYSRSQEYQADKLGAYYAWRAGYEPKAAVELQEKLLQLSQGDPDFLSELFSTHPAGSQRIKRLRETLPALGLGRDLVQGDGRFGERWQRRLATLRRRHRVYTRCHDAGRKALAGGKAQEALRLARQGIAEEAGLAPLHRLAGDALLALGRPGPAREAYRKALSLDSRYVQALFGIGRLELVQKSFAEAEKTFGRCLSLFPGYLGAAHGLGIARHRLGRYGEAREPLALAVENGAGPGTMAMLGDCLDRLGEKEEAYQLYSGALEKAEPAEVAVDPDLRRARDRLPALRREVEAIRSARRREQERRQGKEESGE